MLVPAGVLVLVILAGIAVDSALAFATQRELTNQAAAIANDATTVTLSPSELQRGDQARPDPSEVDRYVRARLGGFEANGCAVAPGDIETEVQGPFVTVRAACRVPYVFSPAVPGAEGSTVVRASVTSELRFAAA